MIKQYIFFDLDGTLTDPKVGITKSIQYSLDYFGIKIEYLDELLPFIGPPLLDSFMSGYGFDKEKAELAIKKYREYFSVTGIFENYLYEGIDGLLKNLKDKGKTLVLATSKPAVFAEKVLKHFGVYEYFSFVSGSELDGRRSDKSEVIRYAIENCNIKSVDEIIMVGDRKYDIIGAKSHGIDSVGVLYGYGDSEELTEAGATYIVEDIVELSNILIENK